MANLMNANLVEVKSVNKWFGDLQALDNVDLDVQPGKVMVIIGPSGSGKSTLLRCINYLETPTDGQVWFNGEKLTHDQKELNRHRAEIGMVFQSFNLYAHLTIMENITLALKVVKKINNKEAEAIAMEQLKKVGIAEKADKLPAQISGGQQQRAAIARALAMRPKLMLFDEPTSALDPEMIKEVLDVMMMLAKEGITMIIVTHEMGFAREVAHRVVFMDEGQLIESASPDKFFNEARHERTKLFLSKILTH